MRHPVRDPSIVQRGNRQGMAATHGSATIRPAARMAVGTRPG